MTLVVPENFINVHFGYAAEGDDQLAYTSLGFELEPGLSLAVQVSLAQIINDAWQLQFKGATSTLWAMTGSKVTLGSGAPPYLTYDLTGTQEGTGFASALPNNCAILINKYTVTPGRQGRGRMYVPGADGGVAFVSGRMQSTSYEQWSDALNAFMADVTDITNVHGAVLLHDDGSPSHAPSPLINATVNHQIATQRRRMRP